MNTKFDIGEKVLICAEVKHISINNRGTRYIVLITEKTETTTRNVLVEEMEEDLIKSNAEMCCQGVESVGVRKEVE